jgi:integrase
MLNAAGSRFPETWPALQVDKRAVRKLGRGRTTRTSETLLERDSVDQRRAMPVETVEAIASVVHKALPPCPLVFLLALTIGARAEDLHALSFNALQPDPHDDRFMVLHFWQNKVSRWNFKPLLKTDPSHRQLIAAIDAQRAALRSRYGKATKFLFPVFHGSMEGFCTPQWTAEQLRRLCVENEILDERGRVHRFKWHSLRHFRGTQMAQQGHDILAIMLELGHVSPDMAMTYVNRRLDLKKQALLEKGGGLFFTIQGEVDERVAELLMRKDAMVATRVAGGACMLPKQLGDWCDHAHACLSCKHFRADPASLGHFEAERVAISALVEAQSCAETEPSAAGSTRTQEIARSRFERNKVALEGVNNVILAIRRKGEYSGAQSRFRRPVS